MSVFRGDNLTLELFGSSHGKEVGMVLTGVEKGFRIDGTALSAFQKRRAPGSDAWTSGRKEADVPEFRSGVDPDGVTTGEPIIAAIPNTDARPADYTAYRNTPRPGHADYTSYVKYFGRAEKTGGGQFSGRMTAPFALAGGILKQMLEKEGIRITASIRSIGPIEADPEAMKAYAAKLQKEGDSAGGVIDCRIENLPAGIGGPLFEGLEGRLSVLLFAIPGVKGVEFGSGFRAAKCLGSENNDAFILTEAGIRTETNHAGGILGGISDGMDVTFRVALKPTPSIAKPQKTVDLSTNEPTVISVGGRHDPSIVFRAVPVVEAAAAVGLYDAWLTRKKEIEEETRKDKKTAFIGTIQKDGQEPGLSDFRAKFDEIDANLADLLARRMETSSEIAVFKKKHGLPIHDPVREEAVLTRIGERVPEAYRDAVQSLYREIFALSRGIQARKEEET